MSKIKHSILLLSGGQLFIHILSAMALLSSLSCSSPDSRKIPVADESAETPEILMDQSGEGEKRHDREPPEPSDKAPSPVILAKPIEVNIDCDDINENLRCSSNAKPFVREFPTFSEIILPIDGENWHFEIQASLVLTQQGIDRFSKNESSLGANPYQNTSLFMQQTRFNETLEKALLSLPEIYKDGFDETYKEDVYLKVLDGEQNLRGIADNAGLEIKNFVLEYRPHKDE